MGPNVNICAGQNDMVVAWDINCDGRCEVLIKSSDGTRFWDKTNETWGKYAKGSAVPDVDGDGITDYRDNATKVPPFYVSVIDGLTGEEIACNELKYEEATDGSDQYGRNTRAKYMSYGYAAMEGHFAICLEQLFRHQLASLPHLEPQRQDTMAGRVPSAARG